MLSRAAVFGVVVAVAGLTACDSTGVDGGERVEVAFTADGAGASAAPAGMASAVVANAVAVPGNNGTLQIDALHLIVAEFELERVDDDACAEDDDFCEEFEAPPAFVEVPLDGGQEVAVTAVIEAGAYEAFEFSVEDLDDDEADDDAQAIQQVMQQVMAAFPEWPSEASMRVAGTFTPTGGDAVPFVAYFEAEVEIERELVPPVVIDDGGSGATFTVHLDPQAWFTRGDGSVMDLSALDYDATGQVIEFEVEIENGVTEIEFDDD